MRLLVVEDEPDLADALGRGLRRQGYAVDLALDGNEGEVLATAHDYDLLVLDLNLPGLDGMELCRRLRRERPGLLILILTARSGFADRVAGLNGGADDYLVKPFHFAELLARVAALLRRDVRGRGETLAWDDLRLDPLARRAWRGNAPLELTAKEFGILEYLLRRRGEVVSQEEILEHVWDRNADAFTNTVRVHITSLRRKLDESAAKPRYLETLVGQGYRLGEPPAREERA
jgi:DNA-binding response OmpR family regulator